MVARGERAEGTRNPWYVGAKENGALEGRRNVVEFANTTRKRVTPPRYAPGNEHPAEHSLAYEVRGGAGR